MANRINFNIGFQIDKAGLNELQKALTQVQHQAQIASNEGTLTQELKEASQAASQLGNILNQAWNSKLNQLDLSKVNNSIKQTYGSVGELKRQMSQSGAIGTTAYNQVASAILNTNLQLKQSNKLLDEMATTMANTIKWGVTSSIFNTISGSIQKAYGYTKNLDSSLNDIRIVTDKSAESMQKFAVQANNAAKELGASTLDYTQASLIYYQQGLSDEESAARAETTLKAANVTGQTGAEVSEQLTAVWNGYKVTAEETELYVDKLAAVAATTAADLEELSTGMSKVASAANLMGVDMDQLNAQLATIVSVTRQAPESVGTALKTIYARMGDIEAGVDTETTLGNYTAEMEAMGFNVLDMNGNLRDMGEVIDEIGSKWSTMSREQQISLSQTMAGTRQYNNLLSLFDNWDMYTNALETSANAAGTLQKQQDIYMESTEAHLRKLSTEAEKTYDILFDQEVINSFTEALTSALEVFNNFLSVTGGGLNSLITLGSMLGSLFKKQIGTEIAKTINNKIKEKENENSAQMALNVAKEGFSYEYGTDNEKEVYQRQTENARELLNISKDISTERYNELNNIRQSLMQDELRVAAAYDYLDKAKESPNYAQKLTDELENQVKLTNETKNIQHHFIDIYENINHLNQVGIQYEEDKTDMLEYQLNAVEELNLLKDMGLLNDKQKLTTEQLTDKILDEQLLDNKEILQVQQIIEQVLSNQINEEERLKRLKEAQKIIESGELDILEQQVATNERLFNSEIKRDKNNIQAQKLTGFLMNSISLSTSLIGALKTIGDESISAGDKITQLFSSAIILMPTIISLVKDFKELPKTIGSIVPMISKVSESTFIATTQTQGFGAAIKTVITNLTAVAGVALAAVAAIAAISLAISIYTKNQQAKLDAANKEVETSKEIVKQTQEEVNKVKELTATYEELNKQFENNEITQNEYQLGVYNLCTALGLQSEAVRVLAGDYEGLDEAIRNAEKAANDKLLQDLQAQKDSAAASMAAGAAKGTGIGYDLLKIGASAVSTGMVPGLGLLQFFKKGTAANGAIRGFSAESEHFVKGLYDFGYADISENLENSIGDYIDIGAGGFTITAKTDEERYKVYEAIKQALESNAEHANSSTYKQLSQFIESMEPGALAYKESIDSSIDPKFANIASDKEAQILNVQNIKQLDELRNELLASAKEIEGVDDEKAKQLVNDYLASLTEIQDVYHDLTSIDYFMSIDPDASKENIEEILKDLTQEEKNWFYLRFDKTKSIESAQESMEAVSEALQASQAKNNYDMLGSIVNSFEESDENNELTDEQKQIITDNSGYFIDEFGSLDEFYALSYQQQKDAITNLYAEESKLIADNKQQGIEAIQARINKLQEFINIESKDIELRKANNQKVLDDIDYKADIKDLQESYSNDELTYDEFLEQYKKLTEEYAKKYGITFDFDIQEDIQELEQAQEEVVILQEELNDIEDIDINVTVNDAAIEQTKNAVSRVVSEAEKLQSVFEAIGTDSIIDADEIEKIAELYPSLLVGAEKYADGTIKLNSDVVNNFTEGQMEQLTAEKDRQLQSIDAQIKLKEATIKMLYSQLDIAKQVAEGTMTLDEGKGKSQEILGQFIADNSLESYNLADDAAFNSAQNQVDYWNSVTSAAAQAGEAFSAAARGETVNFDKIDINRGTKLKEKDLNNYRGHQLEAAESYNAILAEIQQEEKALGELYVARASIASAYDGVTKAKNGSGSGDDRDEALKSIQEEIDRYWELNKTIEKVTDTIEKLNDEQSKLSGKELIASLKEENELLEQQAEAYKALADEQQREANELRGVLSTYGVVFDAQGGVANYLAASQQALNYYNDAVVKYNSHIIDEATFNAAQSSYENFKSQLERYEALYYEEMKDTQDQLDELHTQQLENNLEQWEIGIQLQLDLSEAERNWNDFLQEINEDFKLTYADISQELSTLLANAQTFTNEEGTFETDIKALKDVMAEIDKFKLDEDSDMFSSMSEAQEKLKELIDTTQSDMSSLYDIFANAWNAYMEGIDQSADKFDDLMGQFENIENELDYQGKLIELIYGEEAYSLLDTLYKAQEKNNYVQIDALKQQRDMWYTLWENAAEGTEEQTKYYELWTQAQDDLNNKVTDYIELLKTDYLNTIDDILKKLETNITGSSLDDLEEEWDRVTESSDKYLDNVESLYEVQTLANKISNSISETSSLKNQQKLQELYDKEIDYLREKENLTKYDLDAANARYEIALKEIALEEAQNSKNSMKLTRGTDGNWSYQYVADQDLVAEKQQDLTDAYKELYDLSKDAYEENLESLTDLQDKYLEAYREIIADETLAAEEKEQKIHELQSYYLEQYHLLAKENALYQDDLAISSSALLLNLYNQDKENFAAMTQEERELVQNLVDANANDFMTLESLILNNYDNIGNQATSVMSKVLDAWSTGAQQIADIWNADDGVSVKAQITEAQNNILDALDTYNYKVEEIAGVVEENFGPDGITGSIQDAEAATEDLEYAVSNLVDNTIDQLYDYRDALEDIEDMWYSVKDAIMEAIDAAREYANAEAIRKKQSAQTSGSLSSANTSGFVDLTPSGGGGGNPGGKVCSKCGQSPCKCNSDTGPTVEVTLYSNPNKKSLSTKYIVSDKNKNNPPSKTYVYNEDDQLNYHQFAGGYINHRDRGKIKNTLGFDTGGYTGDWNGGDGKLAMLHSKELVLNAKDTSNILNAVEVIRDISNLSSSIESMIMDKLSAMILKLGNLNANRSYTSNVSQQDSVENNYYINAEFPNANDVNDIREALLSLSNVASQYRAENKK